MKYSNMVDAVFLQRPNRFIAHCKLKESGEEVVAHVKNTGRCKELLVPGVKVYLQDHRQENKKRKTDFSLIAVEKLSKQGSILINMDSQAPNQVAADAIRNGCIKLPFAADEELLSLRREVKYGDSRFDIELVTNKKKWYVEVKGVTLEETVSGARTARFPDAPTERGVKHIRELIKAKEAGNGAAVIFIVQMPDVKKFTANWRTHHDFGFALEEAVAAGVAVLAYDCEVKAEKGELSLEASRELKVDLSHRNICAHFDGDSEEELLSILTDSDKELLSTFHGGKAHKDSWLCQALMRKAAMNLGFKDFSITRDEKGAPQTNIKGLYVSASHTKGCCIGGASLRPIGIDGEKIASARDRVAQKIFSESEYKWMNEQEDKAYAFTVLWTLKEAYGKMRGLGLMVYDEIEFYPKKSSIEASEENLTIKSEIQKNYAITFVEK